MSWTQILIFLLGGTAVFLINLGEKYNRWAVLFGFASQPIWLYSTLSEQQYGMFLLSGFYTVAWGHGIWKYWLRKKKTCSDNTGKRKSPCSQKR